MKKLKKKLLKGAVKLAENTVKSDVSGWPPPCVGYIYQPKRPQNLCLVKK